jgi:hypothetical protein
VDSICDVITYFNRPNHSSRTIALVVDSASNRNEYQNVKDGWPERKADNPTAICESTVLENMGASASHNTSGLQGLLQDYRASSNILVLV